MLLAAGIVITDTNKGGSRKNAKGPKRGSGGQKSLSEIQGQSPGRGSGGRSPPANRSFFAFW